MDDPLAEAPAPVEDPLAGVPGIPAMPALPADEGDAAAASAAAATPAKRKAGRPAGSRDRQPRRPRTQAASADGQKKVLLKAGDFEVTFTEPQLGILLNFGTNPKELRVYISKVITTQADALGILPKDEIVAIAGTAISDLKSKDDVTDLIKQCDRPTVVKLTRPESEETEEATEATPLSAAAYITRAKAIMEVQAAEDEVARIKQDLAKAVARQLTAKRNLDTNCPWARSPWWTAKDDNWTQRYSELVAHNEQYNTTNLSTEDGNLGKWCKTQRQYYNRSAEDLEDDALTGGIAEGRLRLLDSIGFDISYKEQSKIFQEAWETKFNELLAYKDEHGHCNVPNTPGPHRPLGRWVMKQRGMYQCMLDGDRTGQKGLNQERIDRLEGIGFTWRRGTNARKGQKVTEWRGGGGQIAEAMKRKAATDDVKKAAAGDMDEDSVEAADDSLMQEEDIMGPDGGGRTAEDEVEGESV